jgi:hypothetical protein
VKLGDSGTLAQLYGDLTSNPASQTWTAFEAAVKGLAKGVTSDDPFGALTQTKTTPHVHAAASGEKSHRLLPPGAVS